MKPKKTPRCSAVFFGKRCDRPARHRGKHLVERIDKRGRLKIRWSVPNVLLEGTP